jgi:hypothetical protein
LAAWRCSSRKRQSRQYPSRRRPRPDDAGLLVPAHDASDPEVTILVPALDEELTIGQFIDWCQEGIGGAGLSARGSGACCRFNRTFIACLLAVLVGLLLMLPLVRSYVTQHFMLQEGSIYTHWAILGLWLVSAAFQTFTFASMIRALGVVLLRRAKERPRDRPLGLS